MKRKKKLPSIKKEIKDFLLNEEGKITKRNIFAVSSFLIIFSTMSPPTSAVHNNYFDTDLAGRGGHVSHSSHGSHGSHGQHNQGGWC